MAWRVVLEALLSGLDVCQYCFVVMMLARAYRHIELSKLMMICTCFHMLQIKYQWHWTLRLSNGGQVLEV
jgi:hypothetical protein